MFQTLKNLCYKCLYVIGSFWSCWSLTTLPGPADSCFTNKLSFQALYSYIHTLSSGILKCLGYHLFKWESIAWFLIVDYITNFRSLMPWKCVKIASLTCHVGFLIPYKIYSSIVLQLGSKRFDSFHVGRSLYLKYSGFGKNLAKNLAYTL